MGFPPQGSARATDVASMLEIANACFQKRRRLMPSYCLGAVEQLIEHIEPPLKGMNNGSIVRGTSTYVLSKSRSRASQRIFDVEQHITGNNT